MITTSFAYGESYGLSDRWGYDDREHDDLMDSDDFDRRRAQRDGWTSDTRGRW